MTDVCDVPVISSVCDAAGDAAGRWSPPRSTGSPQAMGNAAAWMFEAVWKVFDTTTMVDVTSGSYTEPSTTSSSASRSSSCSASSCSRSSAA